MILELKHLSPYLPYRLKIKCHEEHEDALGDDCHVIEMFAENMCTCLDDPFPSTFKPILRPLSDLTKEIEIDGKKFIPRELLMGGMSESYVSGLHKYDCILAQALTYLSWQQLFEWHFDVFGLIPAGLAININDIKSK